MPVVGESRRTYRWRPGTGFEVDLVENPGVPERGDGDVFRIGHLSDLHYGKPLEAGEVPEIVEEWLRAFREAEVDLVVVSGDLVERPDDRVGLLRMRHVFEEAGLPVVYVPGNHDVAAPGTSGPFYELFGPFPRVERHGDTDVVLLDSFGGLPVDERNPFDRLEAARTGAYSQGRIGRDQLDAAAEMLAPESRGCRLVVTHHHLAAESSLLEDPPESGAPDSLMVPCLDAETLLDWAGERDVRLIFHGHKHAFWPPYSPRDGMLVLNSGSSTRGKPERRARIVDLERGAPEIRMWRLRHDASI